MPTDLDAEKYRELLYKEACEAWDKLEQKRLTEAHGELDKIRELVSDGDRKSMLELIEIAADTLLIFESLSPELRASLANGLKDVVNILRPSRGFLPRGRGERSEEENNTQRVRVFLTAWNVEYYRYYLSISLEEAEAKVADEHSMKEDLVHKYWKEAHHEARQQVEMILGAINESPGAGQPIRKINKVR
jgi:hypothetical protein